MEGWIWGMGCCVGRRLTEVIRDSMSLKMSAFTVRLKTDGLCVVIVTRVMKYCSFHLTTDAWRFFELPLK